MSKLAAVPAGSGESPCCCCSVEVFGETITLTVSGISADVCVLDIRYDNIVLPPTVDIIYDIGTEDWSSDPVGSVDQFFPCGVDPGEPKTFQFFGNCTDEGLRITARVEGQIVYVGVFTALGTSQPNELICDGTNRFCDGDVSI